MWGLGLGISAVAEFASFIGAAAVVIYNPRCLGVNFCSKAK